MAGNNVPRPIRRVAVYLRISKQTGESTSVERQEATCVEWAHRRWGDDIEIVVFKDPDRSGWRKEVVREDFDAMIEQVEAGRLDAVVVYRMDRFTRRGISHTFRLLEEVLEPAGCAFASATEPIDTAGPFKDIIIALFAAFAKMESDTISRRSLAAKEFMRRNGRFQGGPAPYGLRAVRVDGGGARLVPYEPEARVVRELADRVLAGEGLQRLVLELNGPRGVPYRIWRTPEGADRAVEVPTRWTVENLSRLLASPAIAGFQGNRDDGLVYVDGEPARVGDGVLPVDQWRRIRAMFEQRRRRGDRPSRQNRALLASLLYCECGAKMHATHAKRLYRCRVRYDVDAAACPGNAVSMDNIETWILHYLEKQLPAYVAAGFAEKAAAAAPETRALDERIAQLGDLLRRYYAERTDLELDRGLGPDDPSVQGITAAIERVGAQRAQLLAERDRASQGDRFAELQRLIEDHPSLVEAGEDGQPRPVEIARTLLDLAVDRIVVAKGAGGGRPGLDHRRVTVHLK